MRREQPSARAVPSARESFLPLQPLPRAVQVKKCEETKFKSELLKAGVFY